MPELNIVGIVGHIGSGKDTVADCFVENGYTKVSLADPMKRLAHQVFGFTEQQLWGPSDNRNTLDPRYTKGSPSWKDAERNMEKFGPSWVEDILANKEPYIQVRAFAMLCEWFVDLQDNHPNLSPRICLQLLGTEWGRDAVSQDVWVKYMYRMASGLLTGPYLRYSRVWGLHEKEMACAGVVVPDVRFANELEFFTARSCKIIRVVRGSTDAAATSTGVAQHTSETAQKQFDDEVFSDIIQNDVTLSQLQTRAVKLATSYKT